MFGRTSAVVVAAVLALMTGCSVGSPPVSVAPETPATPPAQSSPAPSADELASEEALAAYRGMWEDFVVAGTTSDWRSLTWGGMPPASR